MFNQPTHIVIATEGEPIIIHFDPNQPQPTRGCPAADGQAACWDRCGAGWPGTNITTEAMTKAVSGNGIDPNKLGCQPLQDRAKEGLLYWQNGR